MTYAEKLKDPQWRELRKKVLELDRNACRDCGQDTGLHVHHIYYGYGKEPWEYDTEHLLTLCYGCHEIEHERQKKIQNIKIEWKLQRRGFRAKHFENLVFSKCAIVLGLTTQSYSQCVDEAVKRIRYLNLIKRYDTEIDWQEYKGW